MGETLKRLLKLALDRGAIKYGDFTLSSGKKSRYYFDGRLLSLDPEGAHLISTALMPFLQEARAEAVGGHWLEVSVVAQRAQLAVVRVAGAVAHEVGHDEVADVVHVVAAVEDRVAERGGVLVAALSVWVAGGGDEGGPAGAEAVGKVGLALAGAVGDRLRNEVGIGDEGWQRGPA